MIYPAEGGTYLHGDDGLTRLSGTSSGVETITAATPPGPEHAPAVVPAAPIPAPADSVETHEETDR